jgi:hypothetical protein
MSAGNEAVIKEILSGHSAQVVELVAALRELVKHSAPELDRRAKARLGQYLL